MKKTCKYCKKEIIESATKCPYCQSFQSVYRSPTFVSVMSLLMIPIIFFAMDWIVNREKLDFNDYKENIVLKELSRDTLEHQGIRHLNIIVALENNTNKKWETPEYEVNFISEKGEIVNIERDADYILELRANDTVKSSIKVRLYPEYENMKINVKLVGFRHPMF